VTGNEADDGAACSVRPDAVPHTRGIGFPDRGAFHPEIT